MNYNNKTNTVSSVHALNTQPNQRSLSPPFYSSPFLSCLLPFAPLSSPPPSASDWASADDRLWLSSFSLLLLSRSESRRRPSSRLRWFFWCRSKDDDLSRPPPPPPWFCWLTTRPLISFGLFLRSCAKTTSSSHPLMRKRSISSRASRASVKEQIEPEQEGRRTDQKKKPAGNTTKSLIRIESNRIVPAGKETKACNTTHVPLLTVWIRVLDERKTLRLLRVVVSRDVNIANISDAPEGHAEIVVGDVGPNVAHQQGDSGNPLVPAAIAAATTTTTTATIPTTEVLRGTTTTTPSSGGSVGIASSGAGRTVGIVVRVVVVGRATATGSTPGRPVVVTPAPIVVASPTTTVIIGRSASVSAGRSSSVAVVVPASVSVVSSSLWFDRSMNEFNSIRRMKQEKVTRLGFVGCCHTPSSSIVRIKRDSDPQKCALDVKKNASITVCYG